MVNRNAQRTGKMYSTQRYVLDCRPDSTTLFKKTILERCYWFSISPCLKKGINSVPSSIKGQPIWDRNVQEVWLSSSQTHSVNKGMQDLLELVCSPICLKVTAWYHTSQSREIVKYKPRCAPNRSTFSCKKFVSDVWEFLLCRSICFSIWK